MTTNACITQPDSGRDLTDPLLPEGEISGRVARKVPRRVLVVDDEPLIRWAVTETLAGLGLEVEQAGDAAAALRAITTDRRGFDVVVLDLRLPDMRDLSLMGTIRQLQPAASIVVITAFGTDDIAERAVELGARTVLNKPFALGDLVDAVYGLTA